MGKVAAVESGPGLGLESSCLHPSCVALGRGPICPLPGSEKWNNTEEKPFCFRGP